MKRRATKADVLEWLVRHGYKLRRQSVYEKAVRRTDGSYDSYRVVLGVAAMTQERLAVGYPPEWIPQREGLYSQIEFTKDDKISGHEKVGY
jgi:hypothetical protein